MPILRLFDFFFFMRPIILIPLWSFMLLGYAHTQNRWLWIIEMPSSLLSTLFIATAFMGVIHILNQIADRTSDHINQKLFFIPREIITIKQAYVEVMILLICAIPALCCCMSELIPLLYTLSILPLGIIYSLPPLRLKAKPIIDTVLNGIGYGWVAFSIGWLAGGGFSWSISLQALPYILAVAAMYMNTTLIDAVGDRQNGFNTTGIWLGRQKATCYSMICIILVIISSILLHSWVCLATAIVSLPVYWVAFRKQTERWINLSLQIPGRVFVCLTGLIFPYYLVFIILLYLFTRWYYKKRFHMTYPAVE
jgi:chlorophyll synthase